MNSEFFQQYPSNTVAGTCNNFILKSENKQEITGRLFYRVRTSGTFAYRFFFCNAVDSTFADGKESYANLYGDKLDVISAFAADGGTTPGYCDDKALIPVTFNGKTEYTAQPGEGWWSDEVTLTVEEGHDLMFQWTVRGTNTPYTPDKMILSYRLNHGEWQVSTQFPQPMLVGCRRPVWLRLAFLGDSITQGLGTRSGLYEYWVARIAARLPKEIAVWDIGLGYGRAMDAASDGVWMQKAKTADIVSVCFGVNDILQGRSAAQIKADLTRIVDLLCGSGVRVGIFTIPPFDYVPEKEQIWRECCEFIRTQLAPKCEYCIETAQYWGFRPPFDHQARFGGHPSGEGCELLATDFVKKVHL